jgi:hypothetical protein
LPTKAAVAKKRAGHEALLVALFVLMPIVIVLVIELAAFIAPRTCFPPKTWTAAGAQFVRSLSRRSRGDVTLADCGCGVTKFS